MSIDPTAEDTGAVYRDLWGKTDHAKVTKEEREKRSEAAVEIANAYWDLANDNYEEGWHRKFHFAPFQRGESLDAALSRCEHYIALMTNMKPGMKILDVGCGNGAPARSIAAFVGCHITGISVNRPQIARAKLYSEEEGLTPCVEFVAGDFCKMPFPDNSFDGAFAIEATCHSPSLEQVYTEVVRVLKPGGYFGTFEWLMTDKFNEKNPVHNEIKARIERGDGVTNLTNRANAIESLKRVGLELVFEEDRGPTNYRNPVPWWWPLDGNTSYAVVWKDRFKVFFLKKWVYLIVSSIFWVLELLHIVPKGRCEAIHTTATAVYGLRDGGQAGIFTPSHRKC